MRRLRRPRLNASPVAAKNAPIVPEGADTVSAPADRMRSESEDDLKRVAPPLSIMCVFLDRQVEEDFRETVLRPAIVRGLVLILGATAVFCFSICVVTILGRGVGVVQIALLVLSAVSALVSWLVWHRRAALPWSVRVYEMICTLWFCVISVFVSSISRVSRLPGNAREGADLHSPDRVAYIRGVQFIRQALVLFLALGLAPVQLRHLTLVAALNFAALLIFEAVWPMYGFALPVDYMIFAFMGIVLVLLRRGSIRTERSEFWLMRSTREALRARRAAEALEAEERIHAASAEAAKEARSRLIRTTMHDLRTPMLSVNNLAVMLHALPAATRLDAQVVRESLSTLELCSSLMERIVSDMLDFERIDQGRMLLVYQPFRLGALLEAGEQLLGTLAERKGVRMELDCPPELARVWLRGDFQRLLQCLQNGLSNAVKFSDGGRVVTLRAWRGADEDVLRADGGGDDAGGGGGGGVSGGGGGSGAGGSRPSSPPTPARTSHASHVSGGAAEPGTRTVIHVAVDDQGIGLSPDELATLQQGSLFAQVGRGQLQGNGGTGLGLAITRQILKLHGGSQLRLSSAGPGKGMRFEIIISCDELLAGPGGLHPSQRTGSKHSHNFGGDLDVGARSTRSGSYGRANSVHFRSGSSTLTSPRGSAIPDHPAPKHEEGEGDPSATRSANAQPVFPPGFRCLHVEDDAFLRMTLPPRIFAPLGVEYDAATDGSHALELAAKTDYAVVLMDNQMPVMSGITATRRLRELGFSGSIIGITGDPIGSPERREFEASGLSCCVDKGSEGVERVIEIILSYAIAMDAGEEPSDSGVDDDRR